MSRWNRYQLQGCTLACGMSDSLVKGIWLVGVWAKSLTVIRIDLLLICCIKILRHNWQRHYSTQSYLVIYSLVAKQWISNYTNLADVFHLLWKLSAPLFTPREIVLRQQAQWARERKWSPLTELEWRLNDIHVALIACVWPQQSIRMAPLNLWMWLIERERRKIMGSRYI